MTVRERGRRDEGFHRLGEEMGVADRGEQPPRCSGFSATRLETVCECLAAGGNGQLHGERSGTIPPDPGTHAGGRGIHV